MKKINTCCICGKKFFGFGNNPWPIKNEGLCCDECNSQVIAAKVSNIFKREKPTNEQDNNNN